MSAAAAIVPSPPARRWPWLLGWLLLTIFLLDPPRQAFDETLDPSNHASYERFFATRAQWGEDVMAMTGPYGFLLYGYTYTGELFWLRFVGDFLLKALFSALAWHLFRASPGGGWRWAWLAGTVVLVPLVDDLFHDFAIVAATLCLLRTGPRLDLRSVLACGSLGLLALIKGTHFLTTGMCVALLLGHFLVAGQLRHAARLAALFAGSLVGFWSVAGQNPANIPLFARTVLELSSGYNDAMGLVPAPLFLEAALVLVVAFLGLLVLCATTGARRPERLVALLVLAGVGFVKWKHGFLRADGHVAIFFAAAGIFSLTAALATFTPLFGEPAAPNRPRRRAAIGLVSLASGLAVIGALGFHLALVGLVLVSVPAELVERARHLVRPTVLRDRLEKELAANRLDVDAPQIRNEVGTGSIDFYGYEQGLLLLNGLNYHPRPMGGGSFNVVTPWLQESNARFVEDSRRAPDWQVVGIRILDDRLPTADDPLTLTAILHGYSPVLMQRDYLLLQRRRDPQFPSPRVLATQTFRPGERLQPPDPGPGQMLLFTLDTPLTFAGRLRAFLYRPPSLTVELDHDRPLLGREFKVWPVLYQRPVLLAPLVLDTAGVIELFGQRPVNPVRSFAFQPEPGYDTSRMRITYYALPRPPPPEVGDVEEILTYHRHPFTNRPPVVFESPPTGIKELNKEPITSFHAPGTAIWDLAPGDQQFIFSYGMMPRTWLEGDTDGVEFTVDLLLPGDRHRVLFKRTLRPRSTPADQGMQRARIHLPPYEPGARLRLHVGAGQDNNANYDQAYITRVQFKSGPLQPAQFHGLGVVPADGKLPDRAIAGIGERPVYFLHAPDEVLLNVPAGAREFTAEIGLLPAAYTGGGTSDGVEYTATLVSPEGRRRDVASRMVNPRQVEGDRGPVHWRFELPEVPAGSRLMIRTDVGPNGDRGWDQSYIADVVFR